MAELNLVDQSYYATTALDYNPNPATINDFPTARTAQETSILEGAGQIPTSSGGSISPSPKSMSQIKASLLQPALSSHYQCWFNPPDPVRSWSSQKGVDYTFNAELISLSCCEASLPGSSFMTNEIADDHTGVTERHAYRRQYDDRSDFTFYVDHGRPDGNYNVLRFFENWMSYIAGEEYAEGLDKRTYFYRVRYPEEYQSDALYLNKFEKDYNGNYLEYRFLQAYPISISSIPISYDSSQLLKCTVSFTYTRYVILSKQTPRISKGILKGSSQNSDGTFTVDILESNGSLTTKTISSDDYYKNYPPNP